jgi:hypothetical protein
MTPSRSDTPNCGIDSYAASIIIDASSIVNYDRKHVYSKFCRVTFFRQTSFHEPQEVQLTKLNLTFASKVT